jgi:hypothetical protein
MSRGARSGPSRLLALMVLGITGALAPPSAAQASDPNVCPTGVDLFNASAATVGACGDVIVPRVSVTSLTNGATESVYVTAQDKKVTFITPPPTFEASKASPAELELYGVPAEPSKESPEYSKWKEMIDQGIHFVEPPEHLVQAAGESAQPATASLVTETSGLSASSPSPAARLRTPSLITPSDGLETGSNATWGGYVNDVPVGSNENAYTHVTGYYKEPAGTQGIECPSPAASATWVGLGGWDGNEDLGQDGTVQRWEEEGHEEGHHQAWYEVEPKAPTFLNLYGSPGYFMEADTKWLASEGTYQFYLYNYKTGQSMAPKAEGEFDGETADFIVEREHGHELFDFEKVTFQGYTNGRAFQYEPDQRVDMVHGPKGKQEENVRVSNVVNKYEFSTTFKSCTKANTAEEKEFEHLGNGHPAPKVTTGESSEITGSTAKLSGTVTPEDDNTTYQFEYGVEAGNFEASSEPQSAGEGVTAVPVSASVTGLRSDTTYHYRLTASSGNGSRDGEERTFKTTGSPPPPPPTVATEGASGIGTQTATVEATVNPNGGDTHYYFEYGRHSGLYEASMPASPGTDAGAGTSPVKVSFGLTGLAPYSSYYYRVVASNSTGTSYGAQKEFITLFASPVYSTHVGEFTNPQYAAIDGSGDVWVTELHDYCVQEFSESGTLIRTVGSTGSGTDQCSYAEGVAINQAAGDVYVVDSDNNRVEEFSTSGTFIRIFGSSGNGPGQFTGPVGIAVEPNATGDVWVADKGNYRVEKFSPTGAFIAAYGKKGKGNGEFKVPCAITINEADDVYVTDNENQRVEEFSAEGAYLNQFDFKGGNQELRSIAADPTSGSLFLDDWSSPEDYIKVLSASGTVLGEYRSRGAGPDGIAINTFGDIYGATSTGWVEKWLPPAP